MNESTEQTSEVEQPRTPRIAVALAENRDAFLRFLEPRVGSRADAEDIFQAAFARGLDRLDTLRDEESAIAWFYRILRNAVVDHYRRQASASRALESFANELAADEPVTAVIDAVCACVVDLAATLKPEYAEAIRRIEVDGVAVKSFANEVGITSNNAAVRVFRAREALRRQVVASCGACATHGCFDCICAG